MISGNRQAAARFPLRSEEEPSVERRLAELAESWNPLLGAVARRDLVEDVDSLIADELHRIQRSLSISPKDGERIENLTELIARRPALSAVRSREALREYIRLSIIKLLRSPKTVHSGKARL